MIFEGDGTRPSPQYTQRANFYGVAGIPHAQFQGTNDVVGGGTNMLPYYMTEYNNFVNLDSPIFIDLSFNVNENGQIVPIADVEVTGALNPDDTNKFLFFLTYYYSESYSCSVQRYEEFDFNLQNIGDTETFTTAFDQDAGWDIGNVRIVAVVQKWNGSTGNYPIHQGAIATYPLTIPNPVPGVVMNFNDTYTHDLTNYFYYNGEPVNADLSVQSSDPSIVEATLDGNTLILTSFDLAGPTQIDIIGSYDSYTAISSFSATVADPSNRYVLIWDLDPTPTGQTLASSIENFYALGNVHIVSDFDTYPLANADALFILLGVYSMNYVLEDGDVVPVVDYLNIGGNVYIEGADTWYYDGQTPLHDMFNINGISDGSGDLSYVDGMGFLDGLSWSYSGGNNYMDHLVPIGSAFTVFVNPSPSYNCGIAYDSGTYKTVGTSFEITGLGGTNSLDDAIAGIIEFFDFVPPLLPPANLVIDDMIGIFSWEAPVMDDLTGYDVYLDGVFQDNTSDLEWQYTDLINGTIYEAGVVAIYDEGESDMVTLEFTYEGTDAGNDLVTVTELKGNYPNPFNPTTTISYSLKEETEVKLNIYNLKGQLVKTLVNEVKETGDHIASWNGTDNNSKSVSSGVYFYKMKAGKYTTTKKMILMK